MRTLFIRTPGQMRRLSLLLLLGLFPCLAIAGPPPASFQQGNALYAAGKYAEAAAAYENAVRAGAYSANLFYNLGNAYDRLGERGRAILNYRRALLLEPAHAEARANLAYVQGSSAGRAGPEDSWLSRQLGLPEIDLWAIAAAAAGCLGMLILITGGSLRGPRGLAAAACLALAAALAGATYWRDDGPNNAGRAIVLGEKTRALYAPADSSKVITQLAVGSEIRVLSEQGAWVYAQLADGSHAWLPASNVGRVIPGPS